MIDPYTRGLVNVAYPHYQTHQGNAYAAQVTDESLSATDTLKMLMITADSTDWVHLVWGLNVTGEATIQFLEAVTVSAEGTAVTALNRNRNSANTPGTTVKKNPTVTDNGTQLISLYCGTTGLHINEAQISQNECEWILKPDTKYVLALTAHGDLKARIFCEWSEHAYRGLEGWQ